jgi:hypothetical protein
VTRVEKRKWDGTVSAVDIGQPVDGVAGLVAWHVPTGSERQRPSADRVEAVTGDEIWAAEVGSWWVLCGYTADGTVVGFKVHAAAPFESPRSDEAIMWIDLDLDFEVSGDAVEIEDEAEFHEHARTMGYPDDVVRGAWSGISWIAARYTTGEWPFDGTIQRCLDLALRSG